LNGIWPNLHGYLTSANWPWINPGQEQISTVAAKSAAKRPDYVLMWGLGRYDPSQPFSEARNIKLFPMDQKRVFFFFFFSFLANWWAWCEA